MYLHVPFCKSICSFCNYKRLRVSSSEALTGYVDFLLREMQVFSAALAGVRFGALYVGGGTPSVLPPVELDRLMTALHQRFAFHERAQKNFEYDPMVMTAERFEVLERFGFTRYSFGIQSVDVDVNALHNRGPQGRGHVNKQFALLNRHGAENVNVDFLLGLDGTTPEGIVAEVDETIAAHRPAEVSVYFVTPTPAYLTARFGGSHERFMQHRARFDAVAHDALARIADRHEYAVNMAGRHVVVLSDRRETRTRGEATVHHYCDIPSQIHRPLFLLGLGDSARSRVFANVRYRAEHEDVDLARKSPRYVGVEMSMRDEMFSYLAFVLRDEGAVSHASFRSTFGVDLLTVYGKTVARLEALGAVEVEAERLKLTATTARGRLRDTLFFLSRERRADLREALRRR